MLLLLLLFKNNNISCYFYQCGCLWTTVWPYFRTFKTQ